LEAVPEAPLSLDTALEWALADPDYRVPVELLAPTDRALYYALARDVARWRAEEGIYE
jgi:hypothetical protein